MSTTTTVSVSMETLKSLREHTMEKHGTHRVPYDQVISDLIEENQ